MLLTVFSTSTKYTLLQLPEEWNQREFSNIYQNVHRSSKIVKKIEFIVKYFGSLFVNTEIVV